jgi:hypothetical protein
VSQGAHKLKLQKTDRITERVFVVMLLAIVAGCASTTTSSDSSGSWQHGRSADAPFNTVFIIAIAADSNAREAFEQALAKSIDDAGGNGIAAHRYGRQMGFKKLTRDIVLDLANKSGSDAILITRVLDQEMATGISQEEIIVHVGPMVRVAQNEDASMTAIVASNYAVEIVPGSMVVEADTLLESRVYQPSTGDKLLYRATTDTHFEMGPGDSIEAAAYEYGIAIGQLLRKDGVIR